MLIPTVSASHWGGVETWLEGVVPALLARGHEVAMLFERDGSAEGKPLVLPEGVRRISRESLGASKALGEAKAFRPDVVYPQAFYLDHQYEADVLELGPVVFDAHVFYGTCISSHKVHRVPRLEPCDKVFGPACLAHYFPRRCGGKSPVSMVHFYRLNRKRQRWLGEFRGVVVHSEYMKRELGKHGIAAVRVPLLPMVARGHVDPPAPRALGTPRRIAYAGRLDELKGGALLIDALGFLAPSSAPLHLVMAGEGVERAAWEARAKDVMAKHRNVTIEFAGWIDAAKRDALFDASDVLAFPSAWPEPFGLSGFEAARRGLPAVGFDVGGVREWLDDGTSGYLAPGDPPTAEGLATAIGRVIVDSDIHAQLRRGALATAERLLKEDAIGPLENVLRAACA